MLDDKMIKELRELYLTIGRVLDGKPEDLDEELLYCILNKLHD